ncbi:hypothetical protein BsWGS_23431 [Bradybaena similaris]
MAGNISEERTELQEDDEKFQTILHEFGSEWGYETSDEDVDDDDHLLIDLDYDELSDSEQNEVVRSFSKSDSLTPSYYGSGSQSLSYTAADEENGEVVPRPNLELPSQVNVAQYKADPLKTLHLNRALQGILEEHISNIKTALKGNKEKQDKLEDDASDSTSKAEKKGMYVGVFRAPYFRDGNSYPPANEDVIQKKITGDYDIVTLDSMKDLRQFNKTAKLLLREAVFEDCMEKALKPIVAKMEAEIEKRDKCIEDYETMSSKLDSEKHHMNELRKCPSNAETDELIEEVECTVEELKDSLFEKSQVIKTHKDEIARLEQMIKTNRNTPVEQLLATVDSEKVDWMKIAKSHFSGHSTWVDCQKAWENLVSPRLNTRPWTKDEEKKLLDLVKKSTTNDWKQVASDLGTARTAFQCFSHYQQKFNSDLKPRPWSSEEDATLVRITNNVKDSVGFYNWSKVSTLMDSRSPIECMYRFTKVDPSQSRGRFTMVEDAKLLAAVKMIGPCWSKIAKFIGTRNMVQCRDRYLNCLAPNINFSHFTYDEDVKLLKLRKNFGQCWAKMVPEFIGRTDSMLLNRYRQLQRWQRQSDWFERQTDATKRMLLGKSLTVTERHHFRARAEDYLKFQLGVFTEDYKRQELDRLNHVDPDIIPPRPPRHLRCYSFGASRRGCNLNKWSERLNVHMKLTENLHKLLKKEIINTAAENKREGLPAVSEELREEIMHKTVEETLKENKGRIPSKFNAKQQVKKLEAALNKAFLTSGNISVQELMRLSALQKKRTKTVEKNTMVDSELKNLLRRRGRTMTKQGRTRQFFDKDTRPRKVIEEELDECDQSVPVMLMKAIPTTVAEANVGRHRGVQGDDSSKQEILDIPECMRTLRRTDEYKLLLARFRALFMWPVFMSTVKPSPLYDPSLPTSLRYVNPDMAQQPVRNRRGRRCKGKLSIAKREHLKTLHARSLAARAKKRASKENAAGQGNGVGSMDIDVGAGVSVEQQTAVPESDAVVSSEQQTTLSTPAESSERSDTNNMASAGDGENLSESNAGNENVTERKRRRRTVRPKGSTTNKYELVLRERSTRIKKNVLKNAPPPEPAKEAIKQLPQWWKDAVLAYMLAKKAIANGQEENEEVRIDEDDEFFDKGNYSDDEWYQQLREEELKISKQQGHNEIVKQDAEALASQDNGAEDIVLFFNPDMVALTSQDTVAQDIVLLGNQDDVSLTSQDTVANDIVSLGNQDVVALASQDTVAQDIVLLEK